MFKASNIKKEKRIYDVVSGMCVNRKKKKRRVYQPQSEHSVKVSLTKFRPNKYQMKLMTQNKQVHFYTRSDIYITLSPD